jgi:TolB-like protein
LVLGAACLGDYAEDELVFVEQEETGVSPQAVEEEAPSTRQSQVEFSGQAGPSSVICVLPFRNVSRLANLNYLSVYFQEIIMNKLEEFDRLFDSMFIDQEAYAELAESLGKSADESPDKAVADEIKARHNADIILFGDINVVESKVVIEPYLVAYNGNYSLIQLDPMPVTLNNFLSLVDPLVENLINNLIEQQEE